MLRALNRSHQVGKDNKHQIQHSRKCSTQPVDNIDSIVRTGQLHDILMEKEGVEELVLVTVLQSLQEKGQWKDQKRIRGSQRDPDFDNSGAG